MNNPMPKIDLDANDKCRMALVAMSYEFTNPITGVKEHANGLDVARMIVATQGKNAGHLRASKPPMNETIIERVRYGYTGQYRTMSLAHGAAAQVWRHVAFLASPLSQHHCLPVMADFDAPFDMPIEETRKFSKWCQQIADIILTTIPIEHQPGLRRWAGVLGGR